MTRFIDLQFPAEHKSLCSPELEPCQAPEINNVTHWISPGRGQPWALFEEKPQAIHVSSGINMEFGHFSAIKASKIKASASKVFT